MRFREGAVGDYAVDEGLVDCGAEEGAVAGWKGGWGLVSERARGQEGGGSGLFT